SKVSSKFGVDSIEIEDALYADLSDEQRILEFTPPEPMELLKEYNFALITGILTQSYEMELTFKGTVEKPSLKLGESIVFSEGEFKRITLKMYSTKYSKSRMSELEKVIAQLMLQDDWRIKAELRQSGRNYILEVSKEKHGALLTYKKLYQVSHEPPKPHSIEYPRKTIIFTQYNSMVYRISREMLIPAITHQTPREEREDILRKFSSGEYRRIVTSKVLEEGVDVPDASLAVILSGTGSSRSFIQRLGRVLRKKEKKAKLIELVSVGTVETRLSKRRKQD
ncbi:DUF790 family protein, partial [Candidatus Bathyarchaeota archaeon]|nr:DUF790 family protein [Candidatus Bathyarchaeota archaeon]